MTHRTSFGTDPAGVLIRIDNALNKMPERLTAVKAQLENLIEQRDTAKAEVGKPFPKEDELKEKSARKTGMDVFPTIIKTGLKQSLSMKTEIILEMTVTNNLLCIKATLY